MLALGFLWLMGPLTQLWGFGGGAVGAASAWFGGSPFLVYWFSSLQGRLG
jgi:hypothetical protein